MGAPQIRTTHRRIVDHTKAALDERTADGKLEHRAFIRYVLDYGVKAMAHVHLMSMARNIAAGQISLDDFVADYGLDFEHEPRIFLGRLKSMEDDSVYVPQTAYRYICGEIGGLGSKRPGMVPYFSSDYKNLFIGTSLTEQGYIEGTPIELFEKDWKPEDLQNPEIVEQGIVFGKKLWELSVAEFEKRHPEIVSDSFVMNAARLLIDHYHKVVDYSIQRTPQVHQ